MENLSWNLQWVLLMLFFSALFSGLEIAFLSTNRLQLELDLKKNKFSARLISLFFHNQSRFITTLLLGNNIALTVYGIFIAKMIDPMLLRILPSALVNDYVLLLLQTLISTLVILLVGEFLPKILFRINPNAILSFFALPAMIIFILLYPLVLIYTGISEFFIRYVFRISKSREELTFSIVDLNDYINEYANPDEVNEDVQQEIHLFQNAIDFHSVKLRECMEPRNEIQALKDTDSLAMARAMFEETKHSKLFVYEDNIDNIIGYLHFNDVMGKMVGEASHDIAVKELIRPIDFFPETYAANMLLRHFTQNHQSVAVVVDEFGGTAGIVTMEDVIEEIFGEINDEYDDEENTERVVDDNTFILSARLEIDYLNETYKLNLNESDDYETLAGFILHYHESIPEEGDEIVIGNYKIKILRASDMKLEEVQLTILSER